MARVQLLITRGNCLSVREMSGYTHTQRHTASMAAVNHLSQIYPGDSCMMKHVPNFQQHFVHITPGSKLHSHTVYYYSLQYFYGTCWFHFIAGVQFDSINTWNHFSISL